MSTRCVLHSSRLRAVSVENGVVAHHDQGCAFSLMTGIRFAERLGGIFGMSGYLPLASAAESEQHQVNRQTPIF
jgi:phospholipase/carboxylesterase